MENIMEYIRPELLTLIPVLYFVGMGLKGAQQIVDKHIPLWLGLCGVVLASLYVLPTSDIASWQGAMMAIFAAITQGVLCAGCSVYANQIYKQTRKED